MLRLSEELEIYLRELEIKRGEVCLLGSASIAVQDITDNKDIEFAVTAQKWKLLREKYNDSFNKYSNVISLAEKIECQKNSLSMFAITDDNLFCEEYSYEYDGFRVVKPFVYMAHKVLSNREKDKKIVNKYRELGWWNVEFEAQVQALLEKAYRNGWERPYIDLEGKIDEIMSANKKIYIFGTGSIGKHVFYRLERDKKSDLLTGFLVSKRDKKDETLFGKRIFELDEVEKEDCKVLISVSIQNMREIVKLLKSRGFSDVIQAYQFYI